MTKHAPTTLLTGATGFLGHHVLRDLLRRGRRVVALVRSPMAESRKRLSTMLYKLGVNLDEQVRADRLLLHEGSLPEDLPDGEWGVTDDIVSCAASLQLLSNGNGEPFRTNVEGMDVLLDWATRHEVKTFHAVSTAYVCGAYKGDVREVLHPEPPSFQTEYERSKWLAEQKVAAWASDNGRVFTLLRPSFLVGDSTTGYTTQFGGFYQFARLVAIMAEHYRENSNGNRTYIPLRIPGRKADPIQNLVPVDFASRMVAEVVLDPSLHGKIYHLTDPTPPTWDDLKRWLEEYFHIHGGYYVDDLPPDHNPAEVLLWDKYELLMPRLHHHVHFEVRNTTDIMSRVGIEFPTLNQARFRRLLDFAATHRWGQKNGRDHNGHSRRERVPPKPATTH